MCSRSGTAPRPIISRRQHPDVTGPGGILTATGDDTPLWTIGMGPAHRPPQAQRRRHVVHVRLPEGQLRLRPVARLVHRVAAHPRGRRRAVPDEHARDDLRVPLHVRSRKHRRHPAALHASPLHDGFRRVERAASCWLVTIRRFWRMRLAAKPQSNLRSSLDRNSATDFGPRSGWGGIWVDDRVKAGRASDPCLIAGYAERYVHLAHDSSARTVTFSLEIDGLGMGMARMESAGTCRPPASGSRLPGDPAGEWLRVKADRDWPSRPPFCIVRRAGPPATASNPFTSLAPAGGPCMECRAGSVSQAYPATCSSWRDARMPAGRQETGAYYEVNERLEFTRVERAREESPDLEQRRRARDRLHDRQGVRHRHRRGRACAGDCQRRHRDKLRPRWHPRHPRSGLRAVPRAVPRNLLRDPAPGDRETCPTSVG